MAETFTGRLKRLLSSRTVTVVILLVSIASRVIQVLFFYNMRDDASYQVMAMQNFLDGHGFSLARVLPADLSTTIYEPLVNWPPGYSLLLAPFYLAFDGNYAMAAITVDILAALMLIVACRGILRTVGVQLYLRNIFTLLTSFFIYYFYFIASTDAIAISFFAVALYGICQLLKDRRNSMFVTTTPPSQSLWWACITFCLLISGWLKYLFIPVIFILPLYLIIFGFMQQHSAAKKTGIITFVILLIGIGGLLFYQKNISGTAAYISSTGRGFFPGHLLEAYPFFPAAFIKPDTLTALSLAEIVQQILFRSFQVIQVLFLLFAMFYLIWMLAGRRLKSMSVHEHFLTISLTISLVITLLLSILSVSVTKEEILPGWFWTYVEDARYYGLATVLIHIGIFIIYQFFLQTFSRIRRILLYLFLLLLVAEAGRGMVFVANRVRFFQKEEYTWQHDIRFQQYASAIIQKNMKEKNIHRTVVTGSEIYWSNRVSVYDRLPVLPSGEMVNDPESLKTKAPVLVLVIIGDRDRARFSNFIATAGQPAGRFNSYSFYITHAGTDQQ